MYRRDHDERREEFRVKPVHDWTSHYADAFPLFRGGPSAAASGHDAVDQVR